MPAFQSPTAQTTPSTGVYQKAGSWGYLIGEKGGRWGYPSQEVAQRNLDLALAGKLF